MKQINDSDVKALVKSSNKLVMIDLFAHWCNPCRSLAPKLEELNSQYSESLEIVKLDIDESPQTPTDYHVRGVPTVLFFKNGELVNQMVGNHPKETIEEMIKKHL